MERLVAAAARTRHIGFFIGVAMTHEHDVVIPACHSWRRVVDQNALAAVIHASVVLTEDDIRHPHKLRRARNRNIGSSRYSLPRLVCDRQSCRNRLSLPLSATFKI